MIKFFTEIHLGSLVIRDPFTSVTNILLCLVGVKCFLRVYRLREKAADMFGWSMFFLFGAIAALMGVVVHSFSYYIPVETHFWIWIVMGWMQNISVSFAQMGTLRRYFPAELSWTRPLIIFQLLVFSALMIYIRKFGAVNAQVALGLLPIAGLNFCLYAKKKNASALIGWGIVAAAIPGLIVALKLMPSPWFNYNDIAHVLLMGCVMIICRGVEKNVLMG